MPSPSYKIGVDGGGTKTEFILVDGNGATVATHVSAGCNPSQVGSDKARALLVAGLEALVSEARIEQPKVPITHTQLYMAGSPVFWRETAATLTGYGLVTTATDSVPVLELATNGAPGLVLHAGTGSFVAARAADGSVHYAGGLGWRLGDAGSGFDLGRRAIAAALLELQGWPPVGIKTSPSPLATALQAHTGVTDYAANSRFFYTDPNANSVMSAFAPRVLELAENDCGAAQQVVADSVTDLARLTDQVIHRLFPQPPANVPCGVSGRILNSVPAAFALRSLATKLRWPVQLEFITTSPIEGVKRLLMRA